MGFPTKRHRRAADRLTERYGGAASLLHIEDGGVDSWGNPTVTETEYTVRALDTGSREAFGVETGLDAGDRIGVLNMLATGAVPSIGDKLTLGGEQITISEIEPVQPNPDETALLYKYKGKL